MKKQYGAIKAVDGVSFRSAPARSSASSAPTVPARRRCSTASSARSSRRPARSRSAARTSPACRRSSSSRRGVGRTFQTLQVFGKLSVRDNLIVAAQEFKGTLASRLLAKPDAGLGRACRPDDRAVPAAARRAPACGQPVVRAAEADRHRDGVHAGAAPRAARRAVRRRQPEPRRPAARAAGRAEQGRRAAASSSSSTTWTSS